MPTKLSAVPSNYLLPSLVAVSPEPIAVHPSEGFATEADAFLEALEITGTSDLAGASVLSSDQSGLPA